MSSEWELSLKIATILVPVFMTIIMVGVGYIVRLLGGLRSDVTKLMVEDADLRGKLAERTKVAKRDHAVIDRRLDEHDGEMAAAAAKLQEHEYRLAEHGRRLKSLEGRS